MTIEEGSRVRLATGLMLKLGRELSRGGAGSVHHLVGSPALVAKIYHSVADRSAYERKLEAMLQLPPQAEGMQLAWPLSLQRDLRGHFCGFTMPKLALKKTFDLETVLQPRQAQQAGIAIGIGGRLTLAANLSTVIARLHECKHRVVDLKPPNIRGDRSSLHVTLLDCDGFSVQGSGERFAAMQFTPEYLAPELHGRFPNESEEEAQDLFALAVVVFQLLNFGLHPFTGTPKDDRVPTGLAERVAGRFYAYGLEPNRRLRPSPVSSHELLPVALRRTFDRAFGGAPDLRPSAKEWAELLRPYARPSSRLMLVCSADRTHQHFAGKACSACARAKLLGRAQRKKLTSKQEPASSPAFFLRQPTGTRLTQNLTPAPSQPAAPSSGSTLFVMLTVVFVLVLWMCNGARC